MSTTQQFHLPLDLWGQKTEMSRLETILLLSHIANLNLKLGTGISSHLSNCQPWLRGKSWIRSLAGDLSYCLKHQIAATSQHIQIDLASQVKACTRAYIYLVSEKWPQTSKCYLPRPLPLDFDSQEAKEALKALSFVINILLLLLS